MDLSSASASHPRHLCLLLGAVSLGLSLAGAIALAVSRPGLEGPERPPARRVELAELRTELRQDVIELDGVLEPVRTVRLAFRVHGRIEEVLTEEGMRVEKDAPLVRIEAAELETGVRMAKAQLARADAALRRLERGPRSEDLRILEEELARARAGLDHADAEQQRFTTLRGRGAATRSQLDSVEATREAARARHAAATAGLDRGRAGARIEELEEARAVRESMAARLARAELDRSATTLTAPFSGVVANKPLAAGTWIAPGVTVLELVDLSALDARIGVSPSLVPLFEPGQAVEVRIRERTLPGVVRSLSPTLDSRTRTFLARVRVSAPGLRGGAAVSVVTRKKAREVLSLPARALAPTPDGSLSVWVARGAAGPGVATGGDPHAERREVRGRWLDDGRVEILGGLLAGEQVVIQGGAWLLPDDRLAVTSRLASAGAGR